MYSTSLFIYLVLFCTNSRQPEEQGENFIVKFQGEMTNYSGRFKQLNTFLFNMMNNFIL